MLAQKLEERKREFLHSTYKLYVLISVQHYDYIQMISAIITKTAFEGKWNVEES